MPALSTDARLLSAGVELFGTSGPEAVGTRALAQAAGVQMSAIRYHFGGKDGLYLACARHIADEMSRRVAPVLARADEICSTDGGPEDAKSAVLAILSGFVSIMMGDDVAPIARFIVREQMQPTAAFDALYQGAMRSVIDRVGNLLQRVAVRPLDGDELRARTVALMGQVLAFRFARATLMRATGWRTVTARETEIVRAAVLAHSRAVLTGLEQEGVR
jgi:AcrR family transcriptional regulator